MSEVPKNYDEMVGEIKKHLSFPDFYEKYPFAFSGIVQGYDADGDYPHYEDDDEPMTKEEYQGYFEEYSKSVGFGTPQNKFDLFVLGEDDFELNDDRVRLSTLDLENLMSELNITKRSIGAICIAFLRHDYDFFKKVEGLSLKKLLDAIDEKNL